MLHVKRKDRGFTCSSLFTDVLLDTRGSSLFTGVLAVFCLGGVSRGRFENFEDNLEKKLVLFADESALVSWVVNGTPTPE